MSRRSSRERNRINDLIGDVVPERIARRLKSGEELIVERVGDVTVIYVELEGFRELCRRRWPGLLTELLDDLYGRFDALCILLGMRVESEFQYKRSNGKGSFPIR